jgi:hypothetical protein
MAQKPHGRGETPSKAFPLLGLVIDYCWFQILCAAVIIEQIRGR